MARLSIKVRKESRTGVVDQFTKLAADAVKHTAHASADEARALAPVLTGALRDSIEVVKISETEYAFGATVEYAPWVEFGTSHEAPQSFVTPAGMSAGEKLIKNLTKK